MEISRREALRTTALSTAGLAAACAPGAAGPDQSAAPTGQREAWHQQWDDLVAAAKKEGKVVIQLPVGTGYREALEVFMAAFPGVEAEAQQFPDGATYIPKIQGERRAGIYSFDVAAVPAIPPLQVLKHEGTYDPLRPLLFRPDVIDENAWNGGYESRWADSAKNLAFRFQQQVTRSLYVNTQLIKEDEIKTLDDLIDPKWKGKIAMSDVAQGYIYSPSSLLRKTKGDDWMRKLLVDQQPMFIRDRRQAVEAIVRGRVPIAFGIHPFVFQEFVDEGVANHVKNLDIPGLAYGGGDVLVFFNRAPHPSASKLFANWLLTKEGGLVWSEKTRANSARSDVPVISERFAAKPGQTYPDPTQEDNLAWVGETQEWLKKLVGA